MSQLRGCHCDCHASLEMTENHRHREERSDVAIHAGVSALWPWIAALRSQ